MKNSYGLPVEEKNKSLGLDEILNFANAAANYSSMFPDSIKTIIQQIKYEDPATKALVVDKSGILLTDEIDKRNIKGVMKRLADTYRKLQTGSNSLAAAATANG